MDRNCEICKHHTEKGCCKWECQFEPTDSKHEVIEELKKIYEEVNNVNTETGIISRGYECYGFRPKTAKEIRTEILDIIYEHIKENKQ